MSDPRVSVPLHHYDRLVRSNEELKMKLEDIDSDLWNTKNKLARAEEDVQRLKAQLEELQRQQPSLQGLVDKIRHVINTSGRCSWEFQRACDALRVAIVEKEGAPFKINQIKRFRELTACSLREGKDFIEGQNSAFP